MNDIEKSNNIFGIESLKNNYLCKKHADLVEHVGRQNLGVMLMCLHAELVESLQTAHKVLCGSNYNELRDDKTK